MTDPITLPPVAALRPLISCAGKSVSRLRMERSAARGAEVPDFLRQILSETLDRLRGGRVDGSWWRRLLDSVGQAYVAPDWIKAQPVRDWLADQEVAASLLSLATSDLLHTARTADDSAARERYAELTGDDHEKASEAVDVVVAVLVAGYCASVPSDQRPAVGLFQALAARVSAPPDPATEAAHTEVAEKELRETLSFRLLPFLDAPRKILELHSRVTVGDLAAARDVTRHAIRYWAARLNAGNSDTLAVAKELRKDLSPLDSALDMDILDSCIAEAEQDPDRALRLLRDASSADGRTVFFGVLMRTKGDDQALKWFASNDAHSRPDFFTSVGWWNWSICMAHAGRWSEALHQLAICEALWKETPPLALMDGIFNAAMLLPEDFRHLALESVPLYSEIGPVHKARSREHHKRSVRCFRFITKRLGNAVDPDLRAFLSLWSQWLRLMTPDASASRRAREKVTRSMRSGHNAVRLAPFALAFDIPFDHVGLRNWLSEREGLGGFDPQERAAEFVLNARSMKPSDFAAYIERCWTQLIAVIPAFMLTSMRIQALVKSRQTARAQAAIENARSNLTKAEIRRLTLIVNAQADDDPRLALEEAYRSSGKLVDLTLLVDHLEAVRDREALLPHLKELVTRYPNPRNARRLAGHLFGPENMDWRSLLGFLGSVPDIVRQDHDLQAMEADALFFAGQYVDAKRRNDALQKNRDEWHDKQLELWLCLATGDWERVADIVDREWSNREIHDGLTLIQLAHFAAETPSLHNRALELVILATKKAESDPRVLVDAYGICIALGKDSMTDPSWLSRAVDLSSKQRGPAWSFSARSLLDEWIPKRSAHMRKVDELLAEGTLPFTVATSEWGASLASVLLRSAEQNAQLSDGRKRGLLPIVAGNRVPVEMSRNWTVALDLTSIMTLHYLGLLKRAIKAFRSIGLSPDTFLCLFSERRQVRFHQPSRVRAARELVALVQNDDIDVVRRSVSRSDALVEEVGVKLATLLYEARDNAGLAICRKPVYREGSKLEEEADIGSLEKRVASPREVFEILHRLGRLSEQDWRLAQTWSKQANWRRVALSVGALKRPVLVDDLALYEIQELGLLSSIATSGLDLKVHESTVDEARKLIGASDIGDDLSQRIDDLRMTLRNALESGQAFFLHRGPDNEAIAHLGQAPFESTRSLLDAAETCDALCIDDRSVNRLGGILKSDGQMTPIVCVLDILRALRNRGALTDGEYRSARHRLRQGGFVFVPPEPEELYHWWKTTPVRDGDLSESVELRTFRQTTARTELTPMLNREEALRTRVQFAAALVGPIQDFWSDESLATQEVALRTHQLWRQARDVSLLGQRELPAEHAGAWLRLGLSVELRGLLFPNVTLPSERLEAYREWLQKVVLDPVWAANRDVVTEAVLSVLSDIEKWDKYAQVGGQRCLSQLPGVVRRRAIASSPEFARRCGFETRRAISVAGLDLPVLELTGAVRRAFSERKTVFLRDLDGPDVEISVRPKEMEVELRWMVGETARSAQLPALTVLSPAPRTRRRALRGIMARLGPASRGLAALLDTARDRELTSSELDAVMTELVHGVVNTQAKIATSLRKSTGFKPADLIPDKLSYFEAFAGPSPDGQDPETYITTTLSDYKNDLVKRDLVEGLDLVCLGALRDDLSPGKWTRRFSHDRVWRAIESIHPMSNPISLLGALDVALYRISDARFLRFAIRAAERLSDGNFGLGSDAHFYRTFKALQRVVHNEITLLDDGVTKPAYWRRMCSMMHAAWLCRVLQLVDFHGDIEGFEKWVNRSVETRAVYADLTQSRIEPVFHAALGDSSGVQMEVAKRLLQMRCRHERERAQSWPEKLVAAFGRAEEAFGDHGLEFPGPLEGHRAPRKAVSEELREGIRQTIAGSDVLRSFRTLAVFSQGAKISGTERQWMLEAVKSLGEPEGAQEVNTEIEKLLCASVVAAAGRDQTLADGVAEALERLCRCDEAAPRIEEIVRLAIQSAAAIEQEDDWARWLDARLVAVAHALPGGRDSALGAFMTVLRGIEAVMPIEKWFHVRARSVALAGIV